MQKRVLTALPRPLVVILALPFAVLLLAPRSTARAQDTPPPSPAAGSAAAPSAAPQGAPPPRAHGPMPRPTNLQILPKDISGPELIRIMHTFEAQVGVECEFCHATDPATHRLNFASDAKPEKNTARVMMRMTRDINEKYLTQIVDPDHADHPAPPVSCGTCHRGQSMPAAFAAPPEVGGAEDHHGPPA
ncbi:MAG TPA: c-type cytochrome [Acidisarcina sp.]